MKNTIKNISLFSIAVFITILSTFQTNELQAKELIVYSSRHYEVDKTIADLFLKQTGITITYYNATSDVLLSKIELGKEKFDLLIAADAHTLYKAKEKGFLTAFNSKNVKEVVAEYLRDKDNTFTAFTKRYRVIAYNTKKIKPSDLDSYLGLTQSKFKNKIALRSGTSGYNVFLVASLIEHFGEKKTAEFLKDLLANTYSQPKGSDRDQLRIIAKGDADVSIVNSYYYGLMANSVDKNDVEVVKNISLYFPKTKEMNAHFNVSAVGIHKGSENVEDATKFIEFLLTPAIQQLIMDNNYEHPVNPLVKLSKTLSAFGKITDDKLLLADIAKQSVKAVKLIQDAGWQ